MSSAYYYTIDDEKVYLRYMLERTAARLPQANELTLAQARISRLRQYQDLTSKRNFDVPGTYINKGDLIAYIQSHIDQYAADVKRLSEQSQWQENMLLLVRKGQIR